MKVTYPPMAQLVMKTGKVGSVVYPPTYYGSHGYNEAIGARISANTEFELQRYARSYDSGYAAVIYVVAEGYIPYAVVRVYVNNQVTRQFTISGWQRFYALAVVNGPGYYDVRITITPTSDITINYRNGIADGLVYSQGEVPITPQITGCVGDILCGTAVEVFPVPTFDYGTEPPLMDVTIDGSTYTASFNSITFVTARNKFTWSSNSIERILVLGLDYYISAGVGEGVYIVGVVESGAYGWEGHSILICSDGAEIDKKLYRMLTDDMVVMIIGMPGATNIKKCIWADWFGFPIRT